MKEEALTAVIVKTAAPMAEPSPTSRSERQGGSEWRNDRFWHCADRLNSWRDLGSPHVRACQASPLEDRQKGWGQNSTDCQVLPDPARLADLRDDPSAIVPERALVFEVTGTLTDFYRALGSSPGLELLGEDEGELEADEDFAVVEKGERRTAKAVPVRLYFTIPDTEALRELVRLWELFKAEQPLGYGKTQWRNVFEHLADVRPWGLRIV
jgi:hypothetical protein